MSSFVKMTSFLVLFIAPTLFGCGGAETAPSTGSQMETSGSHPNPNAQQNARLYDSEIEVEWSCSAAPTDGGPIFFGTSHPDLAAAEAYAVQTCEQQTGKTCIQQGCQFKRV